MTAPRIDKDLGYVYFPWINRADLCMICAGTPHLTTLPNDYSHCVHEGRNEWETWSLRGFMWMVDCIFLSNYV